MDSEIVGVLRVEVDEELVSSKLYESRSRGVENDHFWPRFMTERRIPAAGGRGEWCGSFSHG